MKNNNITNNSGIRKFGKRAELDNNDWTLVDSLSPDFKSDTWDYVGISIADESYILGISKGEVTKTDTLNYRSLKPEKNGIFCPAIFGPIDEYKCECRRYIGEAYKGLRCERCSVIVGNRRLRRLNFGHIKLNTVVIHPWFYAYSCSLLKMTKKSFMEIINFDTFIFIENTEDGKYKKGSTVSSNQFYSELFIYDELVSGSEAILTMLNDLDLEKELDKIILSTQGKRSSEVSDREVRRRDIILTFIESDTSPSSLAIKVLPCLPADLRPIFYLEGGGIATMDINDLYRKTISRNNRLQKLKELETHRIIINNEKFMINQAVVQLMGPQKNTYNKSIAEYLKGKMGFVRRASLGKRGDYTGRAAISVGPEMSIWECGIPLNIAVELFKAFLYSSMLRRKHAYSLTEAKKIVEERRPIVFNLLREIIDDFPIILNRAPTLHRLGIQAFNIKLTNSNAIKISPLVCTGYNADFDGDQMAVHLPISIASRMESYVLMLASNNLFLPSNGRLILSPSKDMVLGLAYLTIESEDRSYEENLIVNKMELFHLFENNYINQNSLFRYRIIDVMGERIVKTTQGRLSIWYEIEDVSKLNFDLFNVFQGKNTINEMIMHVFYGNGWKATLDFLNSITRLGFEAATKSGITYSIDDMCELESKPDEINEISSNIQDLNNHYLNGLITYEELDANIIGEWSKYIEQSGERIIEILKNDVSSSEDKNRVTLNNIYLMYISGARGSKSQIQQVCCLRGFMSKPSGQVSSFVISSSLKEGLNIFEYFESTHGERKGLSDVAIKTSRAGHFTRRLIDVSHSIVISSEDCGTENHLVVNKNYDRRKFGINFHDVIFGKVLAKDIESQGKTIAKKGEMIDHIIFENITLEEINIVCVYSVIYCSLENGICAKCYGMDFTIYKQVDEGTPVGIIAAQSIGEPGTQLTMRTMHTGGVASAEGHEATVSAEISGIVDLSEIEYNINSKGERIALRDGKIFIRKAECNEIILEEVDIKNTSVLLFGHNDKIEKGDMLSYFNKNMKIVTAMNDGVVRYDNFIEDVTFKVSLDNETGIKRKYIISSLRSYEENISAVITICGENGENIVYSIEPGMFIAIVEGENVKKGDVIAKIFSHTLAAKDITGGLPRIIDMFEAKKSINKAIMATHDGIIKINYGKSKSIKKNKQIQILDPITKKVLNKFLVPSHKHISVQDSLPVKKGALIMEGEIFIQDVLDTMGFDYAVKYLIGEISVIYEDQGVNISCKHFEIIIKQITKYAVITYAGDTDLLICKMYRLDDIIKVNEKAHKENKEQCEYRRMIFGITRIALDYYNSFISSSSFQHTISILARAAVNKSIDYMKGVKENVIFGKKIPVGTGYSKFIID